MTSSIPADRLVALRADGFAAASSSGPFVDPTVVHRGVAVYRRRGEQWTRTVLGRSLERRSRIDATVPWFNPGDLETLLAADVEEDRYTFDALTRDPGE